MLDEKFFTEDIFGFHAQQAVEKGIKAWLAFLGVDFPFVHDLSLLLELLEEAGVKCRQSMRTLLDFNTYAVLMRYVPKKTAAKPLTARKS